MLVKKYKMNQTAVPALKQFTLQYDVTSYVICGAQCKVNMRVPYPQTIISR